MPVGLGADYQMSPAIATGSTGSSRSRVSRIQRRHFRNSSSPVSQDVRNLSQSESEDGYFSPSKTGTKRLLPATPPLTPRPPPTSAASLAPSMIRRASNPVRKQSPSPRSSRGQVSSSSGSMSSVTSSHTSIATLTDENADSDAASLSTTSVSNNEAKVLDPVQPHRQGVVPQELRELLKSHENGNLGGQLLISKPPPLPPIVSTDDNSDQTTPTQSEVFHSHYFNPTTRTVDPNNLTTVHPSDPSSSLRVKGHHHHHPHAYHPAGIRQHHRHFILAKAQGLSSAPSTVRLLRYSPPTQQKQDLMMREEVGGAGGSGLLMESTEGVVNEDEERGTAEGILLVKETIDRKDSALQELHQR